MGFCLLLVCRAYGIVDVTMSFVTILFLLSYFNNVTFEITDSNEYVIKYKPFVGDPMYLLTTINSFSECAKIFKKDSVEYSVYTFDIFIAIVIFALLGFMALGSDICLFTVLKPKKLPKLTQYYRIVIGELLLSLLMILLNITFCVSDTFCIFEHLRFDYGSNETLHIQSTLTLLGPITIILYKIPELILLHFLNNLIKKSEHSNSLNRSNSPDTRGNEAGIVKDEVVKEIVITKTTSTSKTHVYKLTALSHPELPLQTNDMTESKYLFRQELDKQNDVNDNSC